MAEIWLILESAGRVFSMKLLNVILANVIIDVIMGFDLTSVTDIWLLEDLFSKLFSTGSVSK